MNKPLLFAIAALTLGIAEIHAMAAGIELDNGILQVRLDVDNLGAPRISSAVWMETARIALKNGGETQSWDEWLPAEMHPLAAPSAEWRREENAHFIRAEYARPLQGNLQATWVVELFRTAPLLRAWVRLENQGNGPRAIPWMPIWRDHWQMNDAAWLRHWRALSFAPVETPAKNLDLILGSRLHSSDELENGVNPYWIWGGDAGRIYFALSWCGGWRAVLKSPPASASALDFQIYLPPEETQLTLEAGESFNGPVLEAFLSREHHERECRAGWMQARAALGRTLYGGPGPWYPFAYNNWYTSRFDVTEAFLQRQLDVLEPYGFDVFIVDAGWYAAVGQWVPDPRKYAPGAFERILAEIRQQGVMTGIWSCPQFVKADPGALPPEVDEPPFYRKFIDGYLLNYAGMDFTAFMLGHVQALRERYGANWWKYDQDFFVEQTRHGVAKNVAALQAALLATRKAHPDLYMENCQSGGRMLNEFTVLMTQNQWIRDGSGTGPNHARSNLSEALGALDFLPPWTVNRWTNNPDRNDPNDDEFTRRYCRSAMAGTWGLVADLPNITARQREVIVREAANYRRLSALKSDCRFDLLAPSRKTDAAGVVFYNAPGRRAGILLLRWDARGAFSAPVKLDGLAADATYRIEDADSGEIRALSGAALCHAGLQIPFTKQRQSALIFVEAIEE